MRKFVWFDAHEHINNVKNTVVANAMISNVEEVVQKCWYTHYLLIAAGVDLIACVTYAVVLNWYSILPILLLFPAILVTTTCRQNKFLKLLKIRQDAEDSWVEIMDEAMDNWSVILHIQLIIVMISEE